MIDWEGIITISLVTGITTGAFMLSAASKIMGLLVGLFISYVALQYIDPKKWKPRPFFCSVLGGALGCVTAIEAEAAVGTIVVSGVAGLIVGFFALKWAPHISLP